MASDDEQKVVIEFQSSPFILFFPPLLEPKCDSHFEGGNWALVRRVKQGNTWHPATDNLQGTHVYGSYPLDYEETFSLPFVSLMSQSTEIMFRSGTCRSFDFLFLIIAVFFSFLVLLLTSILFQIAFFVHFYHAVLSS